VRKLIRVGGSIFVILLIIVISIEYSHHAKKDLISLFPLHNYDQTISHWIKPTDADYDRPLLSPDQQQRRFIEFYNHYFSSDSGASSSWSPTYIQQILQQTIPADNVMVLEKSLIAQFNNQNKNLGDGDVGYGENFRPYTQKWLEKIADNMNISQFKPPLAYHAENRAITVDNLFARALPTDEPYFYSYKKPGQGYPFDNLQMSALWAGTPVYILGESADHVWSLVLTPSFIAWVKSNGVARVSDQFVNQWQAAAKNELAAIVKTATNIRAPHGQHPFLAYVGTVFPVAMQSPALLKLMIPVKNNGGQADIDYANVSTQNAVIMPWAATPHHIAQVMATLQGRPYGWGNSYFYNDCSSELKSLYTPFAIWLPRHSSQQVKQGVRVDKSADSMKQRLNYLMQNGHKLMTIVYIEGHVFMYLGTYPNPHSPHSKMAMSYQDIWGLAPHDRSRRAIIGQSVLFPLLPTYPEDSTLASLASKPYFQISYLDEIPVPTIHKIEMRMLMYPEEPLDEQ
jgi:cell wall-associated NlpC family hydrolase